jgi:hypothetical protein
MNRRVVSMAAVWLVLLGVPAGASALGTIQGRVAPVAIAPEVEVCVVESHPSETCTSPGVNGEYTLVEVPFGPQRIEFLPSHRSMYAVQYYDRKTSLSEAAFVSLSPSASEVGEINADLTLGGRIEGIVTAAGGGALAAVEVCALGAGTGASAGCTTTNPAGEYTLFGLPSGPYKVGFWGRGASAAYAAQFYSDAASLATATPVIVTSGATETGVDAELARGAAIEGEVSAAGSGTRLGGIPVCLFVATAVRPQSCTFSDGAGGYSFLGLQPGNYQVGFSLTAAESGVEASPGAAEDGYLSQYWRGVGSRSEATNISLLPGMTAAGISAPLQVPPAPASALPVAPVASPIVAAPPVIAEPAPKKKKASCKRGYKKKKVKGKARCVKVSSKGHKHPKHKHRSKK